MTGIPAAAAQTIRTAVWDAHALALDHPDDLTKHITEALAEYGWQITPAPVEELEHPAT